MIPSMEMEAGSGPARSPLNSASSGRESLRSRRSSCKSWTLQNEAPKDIDDVLTPGQQVVKCTTQFATCMCVVIAIIKVMVYFMTGKDVVRTSALDSCGDLMANCMVLYTGYRMRNEDKKRYPAGQRKFQSIGCLVFSTFMFALMFGNSLNNIETLTEGKDEIGEEAIQTFFRNTKTAYMADDTRGLNKTLWEPWYALIDEKGEWKPDEDEIDNPLALFYSESEEEDIKKMGKDMMEKKGKVSRAELVEEASEYENEAEEGKELRLTIIFLGICATYKLCLWSYCMLYAIPKSGGSSVLIALATDKRNDFICTYTVVGATFIAWLLKDKMDDQLYDKVDPLVSLLASIFIMYSWAQLMIEHITTLTVPCGDDDTCNKVISAVMDCVNGSPCTCNPEQQIKVFYSSESCSAEIFLTVKKDDASYREVSKTINQIQSRLRRDVELERAIITTSTTSPVDSAF